MSRDSLPTYELLTRVSDGPVRSYHALARTGAVVMAHFVDDTPAGAVAHTKALIDQLQPEERRKVLEIANVEDEGVVVVTKFILDFSTFGDWLVRGGEATPAPPEATPPVAEQPSAMGPMVQSPAPPPFATGDGPGEFTQAFGVVSPDARSAEVAPPEPRPAPLPEPPPDPRPAPPLQPPPLQSPPPTPEAGEFTRAFQALTQPQAEPSEASRPASPPPARPPAIDSRAGDPPPVDTPAAAGTGPQSGAPGDFTSLFQAIGHAEPSESEPSEPIVPKFAAGTGPAAPLPPPPPVGPPSGAPPAVDASLGGTGAGEFTSLFESISLPEKTALGPVEPIRPASEPPFAGEPPRSPGPGAAPAPPPTTGPSGLPTPNLDVPATPPTPRVPEVRWREEPGTPPPVSSPDPRSAPAEPGEFTRIFGRAEISTPVNPGGSSPGQGRLDYPQTPPSGGVSHRPGDENDYLSRLAGQAPLGGASPPIQPSPPPPRGEEGAPAPGGPAVPPWLGGGQGGAHVPTPLPTGPSEYTRVISAQVPQTPAPPALPPLAPLAPAAPPPAAPSRGGGWMLAGIVACVILVLIVILFFVLRSGSSSPDAEGEAPQAIEAPEAPAP